MLTPRLRPFYPAGEQTGAGACRPRDRSAPVDQLFSTSYLTVSTPADSEEMTSKAPRARSRHRPETNGPRSLIRTITDLPLAWLVTRTWVSKASVLLAAVSPSGSNGSPLAVVLPVS